MIVVVMMTIGSFCFSCKAMVVDGSSKSQELSLAYDSFSLSKLDPPMVLQEFVNHGTL